MSKDALTKRELAIEIANTFGLTQSLVANILQHSLDAITDALIEERHIEFRDFGVFEVVTRQSRVGRNPNRPEDVVTIPARKTVKFKPGKRMREEIIKRSVKPGVKRGRK